MYDENNAQWYNASRADFDLGRRHHENDIVVGFVVSLGPSESASGETFAAASAEARFKLRPPVQNLRAEAVDRAAVKQGDIRNLARGAVCETRPREELMVYVRRLREAAGHTGVTWEGGSANALAAQLDFAAKYDRAARKRFPSAGDLCGALRLYLLALEESARAPATGMASGLRWLYLFNDRPPTVAALVDK